MRSPFRSKIRVTQEFGLRPEYYKQFNLKGHEGLDCVPTGTVWDVLALADGVVVNESDDPRSGAYGIWLTIWHPSIKKATQYCHLSGNYVSAGDKVAAGARIGTMGSTGNSTGAHLHLNLFDVDDNGTRLNRGNGYNGGIDPLPFLEADDATPSSELTALQATLDKVRIERDTNWQLYQQERTAKIGLEDAVDQKQKTIDQLIRELEGTKETINKANNERDAAREALGALTTAVTAKDGEIDVLKKDLEKITMDFDLWKRQRKDLDKFTTQELRDEMKKRSDIGILLRLFL